MFAGEHGLVRSAPWVIDLGSVGWIDVALDIGFGFYLVVGGHLAEGLHGTLHEGDATCWGRENGFITCRYFVNNYMSLFRFMDKELRGNKIIYQFMKNDRKDFRLL